MALYDAPVNGQMRKGDRLRSVVSGVVSVECSNGVGQLGLILAKRQHRDKAAIPHIGNDVSVQLHDGRG